MQKTWFITGASRGLGVQIAKAAMQAGDRVVATGRKRASVNNSLGPDSDQLLSVELDVTDADQAQAAVDAAVSRFGAIDVLVNNAGYGHLDSSKRRRSRTFRPSSLQICLVSST